MIRKRIDKKNLIIIISFILALAFMSIGFANYNRMLNFAGTAVVKPDGTVYIDSVTLTSSSHATANPVVTDGENIDFNLSFTTIEDQAATYEAVFTVLIKNESSYDYTYNVPAYSPTASNEIKDYSDYVSYEVSGITSGEKISANSQKSFTVTFTFTNPKSETDTYNIDGDFVPTFDESTIERILASTDNTATGNLTGSNTLARFTVDVTSTFDTHKSFTIYVESDKFVTRNLDNTGLPTYTISAHNPGQSYDFYIAKIQNAQFSSSPQRVKIYIETEDGTIINLEKVTISVDVNSSGTVDNDPPMISNVVLTQNLAQGSATLTWRGTDDSTITDFVIIPYKDGVAQAEIHTNSDSDSYTFNNLSAATYSFVVYGVDSNGNYPNSNTISRATTAQGYACKSADTTLQWIYTVTFKQDQSVTYSNNPSTANWGQAYTCNIRASNSNNYDQPTKEQITITMGGQPYTNFTYNANNGLVTIDPVTGNIAIEAKATAKTTCLVEGTKILLADNTYKNIEDIEYTDLLKVFNHVTGETTEVYPIWIESLNYAEYYRKLTFSDGTTLKAVGKHGIFDVDNREYIDIARCKVGTRVYKLKNNKLVPVTIAKIEDITENIRHYDIVSTSYYNVIADDVLTADMTSCLSNAYGFVDNATYGENYEKIEKGPKIEYEMVPFIPYYLFKGLNVQNTYCVISSDFNMDALDVIFSSRTEKPIMRFGKRHFMMTTSLDKYNMTNPAKYLYEEGSIYKLPKEGAKYFIDTATNIKYQPGENVRVELSTHFRAIN